MTLFGAAESVFEQFTVGDKFVHLGSLLIVIGIMILSECDIPVGNVLWKVGESAPNNIYFYHVLVIAILDFLSQRGVIPEYPMWMKPLIVMAICICLFVTAPLVKAVREKRSMAAGK